MTDTDGDKAGKKVAVALQYEPAKDQVPTLTAKGEGAVAGRIVAIAEAAGVPVEYNEPLARSLSKIELGEQIPRELYRAVAEVIGFVLKKAGKI